MDLDFSQIVPYIPFILKGIWETLRLVTISIGFGFFLGTFLALFKISSIKPLNWFANMYTSIFRGTPLILQLSIIYYATPQLFDYDISVYLSAVLAFGLNSAAYVSEIIRAGIQAVDRGQTEASLALGVSYRQMMIDLILPQAMKNILPALMNEFISLTKESALVSTIGYLDLMRRAEVVTADLFTYFEPYLFVGVIYWSMVMLLTMLGRQLERRLKRSD